MGQDMPLSNGDEFGPLTDAEIDAARVELPAALPAGQAQDAKRYRFLRSSHESDGPLAVFFAGDPLMYKPVHEQPGTLDKVIDAAIAAQEKQG